MILQIDDNYRIRTDEHNFMLEKSRKERWFALCYCQTLDHVLESVRDEKIKNLGKATLWRTYRVSCTPSHRKSGPLASNA